MAHCILLDISSVFFFQNHIFRILAIIFVCFGFFKVFRTFFYITWDLMWITSMGNYGVAGILVVLVFLHSWPQKLYRALRFCTHTYIMSVLNPSDFLHHWAIFGSVADKSNRKGELSRAPCLQKVFRTFFVHVLRYQFETWYVHLIGSATHRVGVSSQSGHSVLLYRQKCVKLICLHLCPKKIYRGYRFNTHTYIASVLTRTDFHHGWALFGPLVATNTRRRDLSKAPHHREHI